MTIKWIRDRYKVIKEIPGGNMSQVLLCIDYNQDEESEVVIKLFNKHSSEDDLLKRSFFREVENLERLKHSNIVKMLDKNKDDKLNAYYICLEHIQGKAVTART